MDDLTALAAMAAFSWAGERAWAAYRRGLSTARHVASGGSAYAVASSEHVAVSDSASVQII